MPKSESRDLAKVVGQAIARQRNRSGLTQEAVAEQLGIGLEAVEFGDGDDRGPLGDRRGGGGAPAPGMKRS